MCRHWQVFRGEGVGVGTRVHTRVGMRVGVGVGVVQSERRTDSHASLQNTPPTKETRM